MPRSLANVWIWVWLNLASKCMNAYPKLIWRTWNIWALVPQNWAGNILRTDRQSKEILGTSASAVLRNITGLVRSRCRCHICIFHSLLKCHIVIYTTQLALLAPFTQYFTSCIAWITWDQLSYCFSPLIAPRGQKKKKPRKNRDEYWDI